MGVQAKFSGRSRVHHSSEEETKHVGTSTIYKMGTACSSRTIFGNIWQHKKMPSKGWSIYRQTVKKNKKKTKNKIEEIIPN